MSLNDKDLLSAGLAAVKHMTEIYNDLASQTDDPQFARELCDMVSEEHNARIRMFEAMRQRGWYNPQIIDEQQLRQAQQKIQQQIQQTGMNQFQSSGSFQQPTGAGQFQQTGWQHTGQYQMSANQYQPSYSPQIAGTQQGYSSGRTVQ